MFDQIELSAIKITRERFREATGDIPGLAKSLSDSRFGQLQPIILDENNELIDGFRRYTAAQTLGWTHIGYVRKGNIPELVAREIELETNIRREDMSWEERVKALAEIDRIKRLSDPGWTQASTAEVAGMSRTQVTDALKVAKFVELFPEIREAKSLQQAVSMAKTKAKQVMQRAAVAQNVVEYGDLEKKIWSGDSVELIKQIPDESFHAVITDPPFGIDYDRRSAGQANIVNAYKDDEDNYRRLLSMAPDIYRVLKPNGWLVWFFGMSWYDEVKTAFRDAGFTVDELPIIWDRTDGRTFTQQPERYFARGYDVAIHAFKGDPSMAQRGKPNVLRIPPVQSAELLVERPVDLYAELIRRLTIPKEIVADFFVGSGSCPAAAATLGRDFFGIELNPERRAHALMKIKNHLPKP